MEIVILGVFCLVALSRQTTRHFSSAQYFYNTKQGKKIIGKAPAFPNYFFALFQVIKILMYEILPCKLPAKTEHLETRQKGHFVIVGFWIDFIKSKIH